MISGKKNGKRAGIEEVAERTVKVLKNCVPGAVPGIAFLSGGQSDEEATAHLDAMFDSLRDGLAAPLSGMGISFSSSLFGLAGSLVLGFLDLQSSQAQNRFYTELEDWLSTTVYDHAAEPAAAGVTGEVRSAIDRLRDAVDHVEAGKSSSAAMGARAGSVQTAIWLTLRYSCCAN